MPDAGKAINTAPEMEGSDDSEDEDYTPEAAARSKKLAGAAADDDDSGADSETEETKLAGYDSGDEKVVENDSKRQGGEADQDDDVIKTRSQRAQESATASAGRRQTAATMPATEASKIDALWAAMNDPSSSDRRPLPSSVSTEATTRQATGETIEITRTYEFAGQVHSERRTVSKESREARDYLDGAVQSAPATKKTLRRGMKRRSILDDEEAAGGKAKKINTLEASRMAWSGFVDREGIDDELKRANQNGYLDKQDFLDKTHTLQHDRSRKQI